MNCVYGYGWDCYTYGFPLDFQFAEGPAVPNFASSVASLSTPILTPTTLANIEQTFIELQSVTTSTGQQPQDLTRQSGFVPPIVAPIKQEEYEYYDSSSLDDDDSQDWMPPSKRSKIEADNAVLITPTTVATAAQGGGARPNRKSGRRPNIYANVSIIFKDHDTEIIYLVQTSYHEIL